MSSTDTSRAFAITGGSKKGLGMNCAKALLARGDRVFVLSRTEGELAPLLAKYGEQLCWVKTDLTDHDSIVAAFEKIREVCAKLDGLIISAAFAQAYTFEKLPKDIVETGLMMNVAGSIYCMQQAAPMMEGGRVIYISSESVENPVYMLAMYAAVKSAMETFIKGIRRELFQKRKIHLTVLRSGSMGETSWASDWPDEVRDEFYSAVAKGGAAHTGSKMPIDRVVGGVLFALDLPDDCAAHNMDVRSADAF